VSIVDLAVMRGRPASRPHQTKIYGLGVMSANLALEQKAIAVAHIENRDEVVQRSKDWSVVNLAKERNGLLLRRTRRQESARFQERMHVSDAW
jgi:regulation of enolase protein 1 (concanavalin A-like superfamily)